MFRRSDEESEREYTGIQRIHTKCVCEREILCVCVLVTKEKTVDETDQWKQFETSQICSLTAAEEANYWKYDEGKTIYLNLLEEVSSKNGWRDGWIL